MALVSKRLEYCLIFLGYLVRKDGEYVSIKTVCQDLKLPYRFLSQLSADLKNVGIVESKEGRGGGYFLNKDWRKRNIYDLMEKIGEKEYVAGCIQGGCSRENGCVLRKIWQRVEDKINGEFRRIKIYDIKI